MKKLSILLILGSLIFITGCSKNSDDNPNEEPKVIDKSANLLATGESANDLLSNDKFTKLKIEIAYVTGFRPTVEAMTDFITYIKQNTFKQDIELIYKELGSPDEETLTLQEIAKLESDNRTVYNDGETLAIYIYFADAPSDDDDDDEGLVTLGAVYRNTSMIIHEVTVQKLANLSPFITIADVENTTINHEFGHLFGLVNLGSAPVNNHEDAESENHCEVPGCLMRSELQFGGSSKSSALAARSTGPNDIKADCSLTGQSVLQMLEFQTSKGLAAAPNLDSECILDLQANGGR